WRAKRNRCRRGLHLITLLAGFADHLYAGDFEIPGRSIGSGFLFLVRFLLGFGGFGRLGGGTGERDLVSCVGRDFRGGREFPGFSTFVSDVVAVRFSTLLNASGNRGGSLSGLGGLGGFGVCVLRGKQRNRGSDKCKETGESQ